MIKRLKVSGTRRDFIKEAGAIALASGRQQLLSIA